MIDFDKVTPFQRKVYEALMDVPYGKVITYKVLGERIGCRSPRAIGQAMKRNPFAPEVPCHRVIKTDGTIGGFFGASEGDEVARKLELLASEAVVFDQQGKVAECHLVD